MKFKKFTAVIAALSLIVTTIPLYQVTAYAYTGKSAEKAAEKAASVVEDVTGTSEINTYFSEKSNSFVSKDDIMDVAIPKNGDGNVKITDSFGNEFSFSLPSDASGLSGVLTDNGTIVYGNGKNDSTICMQDLEGSVRATVSINDASASNSYEFNYNLPSGYSLAYATDDFEGTSNEGAVYILDSDNNIISLIAAPWATDANGNSVDTYYKIDGTTLIQVVEFDDTSAFPIVADPTTIGTVYRGEMTAKQCRVAYNYTKKATTFLSFTQVISATSTEILLATISAGVVGASFGLAYGLACIFTKYNTMTSLFELGADNKGMYILLFASGDISAVIHY